MKIKIETTTDTLSLIDGKIHALSNGKEYVFDVSQIEKALILTTDMGPFYDDVCLAIEVGNEDVIFIMSEHPSYQPFLFDQLGKTITIDYKKIIDASICTDNQVFEIYKKPE